MCPFVQKHRRAMELKDQITTKQVLEIRSKYLMIRDLCYLLSGLLPQVKTRNPIECYDDLLEELGSKERGIFNLLVHQLTLLHRNYRMKERGSYLSEKEDILIALEIMGSRLNPMGFMSSLRKEYYLTIETYFGHSVFKRKEVMGIIGLKKSHTQRILNDLVKAGMLYQHERKGSLGYLYQIMKTDEH